MNLIPGPACKTRLSSWVRGGERNEGEKGSKSLGANVIWSSLRNIHGSSHILPISTYQAISTSTMVSILFPHLCSFFSLLATTHLLSTGHIPSQQPTHDSIASRPVKSRSYLPLWMSSLSIHSRYISWCSLFLILASQIYQIFAESSMDGLIVFYLYLVNAQMKWLLYTWQTFTAYLLPSSRVWMWNLDTDW